MLSLLLLLLRRRRRFVCKRAAQCVFFVRSFFLFCCWCFSSVSIAFCIGLLVARNIVIWILFDIKHIYWLHFEYAHTMASVSIEWAVEMSHKVRERIQQAMIIIFFVVVVRLLLFVWQYTNRAHSNPYPNFIEYLSIPGRSVVFMPLHTQKWRSCCFGMVKRFSHSSYIIMQTGPYMMATEQHNENVSPANIPKPYHLLFVWCGSV